MIEIKNNFMGGLDLDSASLQVEKNAYIDALNITRDAIVGTADRIISNIVGNRIVSYSSYPAGRPKIIGMKENPVRGTVIFFRWVDTGYHGIYEFSKTARTITKIFENKTDSGGEDILGFTESGKINNINILNRDEGDLLLFLDSLGRPTKMDIPLFKAGTYTPVTREIINVAVTWPQTAITCVYNNDTTVTTNNHTNKLYKFQYVWVYDDLTESVGSPVSATPLPANILNPVFTSDRTNNNVINLAIPSGDKSVKKIKLLMSYVEKTNVWSDFVLVDTIDKNKYGYPPVTILDDVVFDYAFFNDSTYPVYDLARRIQLFDYVPLYALAQEMPNGNALAYAGITEGYDNDITPNVTLTVDRVAQGSGGVIGNLTETHVVTGFISKHLVITFAGTPATGTVVTITANTGSVTFATYTTIAGDTATSVASALVTSANGLGITTSASSSGVVLTLTYLEPPYTFYAVNITAPTITAVSNSISTWPFYNQRQIGLAYFDNQGRTNGVVYNSGIVFPHYRENTDQQVLVPFINAKIYHRPPDWAFSYSWVITKDESQYLYFQTVDVNTTESDYYYFDITNLGTTQKKNPTVANVVSWTFQDGDRFRLIKRVLDNFTFTADFDAAVEGIVVSPKINGVTQTDKTFVKIKKASPFSDAFVGLNNKYFIIQLYRPAQPQPSKENLPYFEFGENYPIINPETSDRAHGGMVTNQSSDLATPAEFNFYNGDSYVRTRTAYLYDTPSIAIATFYVQDKNFVDNYISAVNSLDGRPNAIDPNARQAFYPAMIRFSQDYQPNTNINRTNRFLAANFDEYEYSYGSVKRLKVRDRFMRVYQELKTGVVPIFSKIGKNGNGDEITIVTDELLNPIQYYSGDYGIGDAPESLASFNYADYFCDPNKGAILRVSLDGITPISVLYRINSWASEHVPLRTGSYKIYGSFDQRINNYICALEATATDSAYTLSFDEETNKFESFLSYHPEMMCCLGTLLISAKNGEIYTHDNSLYNTFYGTTYDSTVTFVFNENPLFKKTWISVNQIANGTWDCPSIQTNSYSYGSTTQTSSLISSEFDVLEGNPTASFRRDANSIGGKYNGDSLKGNYAIVKLRRQSPTSLVNLSLISIKTIQSSLTPI